jgi:uncharacterized protein YfcZ (UPF0381/DUF406 family)
VTTQIEPLQDKNTYSLDPVNVTTQIEPVQDKNTYSLDPVNVTTQIEPVEDKIFILYWFYLSSHIDWI